MIRRFFVCTLAVIAALTFAGCENKIEILKRAQNYRDKDNLDAAIEEYQRLIETYEDEGDTAALGLAESYFAIGEIYFEMGNRKSAEENYLKAVAHYPNYYEPLYGLGVIANMREEIEKAEEYLLRATEVFTFNTDARRLLAEIQWTRAKRMEEAIIELAKKGEREKIKDLQQERAIRVQGAVTNWTMLAQQQPDPEILKNIGKAYEEMNNWQNATQAYMQSYSMSMPRDIEAAYGMMKGLVSSQMLDTALKAAEQVKKEFPEEAEPYIVSGRVHGLIGELEKALEDLEAALALADAVEKIEIQYDIVRIESMEENYDTAIAMLEEIEKNNPDEFRTSQLLSEIYQLQEKYDPALKQLERYLLERPLDLSAKARRGYLVGAAGNVQKGVGLIQELIEEYPLMSDLPMMIASIYAKSGDVDSAFEWLEQSADIGLANLVIFLTNNDFKTVIQDKRFTPLVRKIQENARQQQQDYLTRGMQMTTEDDQKTGPEQPGQTATPEAE
jgi:tetratricopeptide (TPR) repeat protein